MLNIKNFPSTSVKILGLLKTLNNGFIVNNTKTAHLKTARMHLCRNFQL